MCVSHYVSIEQCWSPCLSFPVCYLGHGGVQVIHNHVHDGCRGFCPAGVLLDWVGPTRGVQPPGMIMGGFLLAKSQAHSPCPLSHSPILGHTGVNSKTWHPAEVTWELPAGTKANLLCGHLVLCTPALPVMGSLAPTQPGHPFFPSL